MLAARKHATLAVASLAFLAAFALAGSASGIELPGKKDREAPSAPSNIRVTSATPTSSSLAWDPSTDNVSVAFYYVYVDAQRARVSGTTHTATNLECGQSVGVSIVAYDPSLNRSSSTAATVSTAACADTQAPSPPSGFRQAATTQSAVVLAWDRSSNDVGVVGYGVYRNQLPIQSPSEPTATLTGLVCGTWFEYQVDAVDAAGNRSARRSAWLQTAPCSEPPQLGSVQPLQASTATPNALPPDTTLPSEPANLEASGVTRTSVSLKWDPSSDNFSVAGYDVYRNGAKMTSVTSTSSIQGGLVCGTSYWFGVEALDAAGNRSTRVRVNPTTSACPPPPANLGVSSVTGTSASLTWSPSSDNLGVAGYDVYRNGAKMTSVTSTSSIQGGLVCGTSYWFGVEALDAAGNRSTRVRVNPTTSACSPSAPTPDDTVPPSKPAALVVGALTGTSVFLTWSPATDNVGVVGYDVYKNGTKMVHVTAMSSNQGGLACGASYWFGVEAVDAAGNRSARVRAQGTTSACTPPPSGGWIYCAAENQQCTFAGTKEVRYGANGTFTTPRIFNSTVACTNATFGDPLRGVLKHCEDRNVVPTPPPPSENPPADQTPPSQPPTLAVASVTRTSVSLTWGASTDNVAVTGYGVYVNGNNVLTASQPGATIPALTCGTAFTFSVDAFDKASNRSTRAQLTASTAVCADAQAPTPPTNVSASSRTATSIALIWSASSDNIGVTGYGLYRGGTLTGTSSTTTGIFSGLTCNTNYTLAVDAHDAAGNRSGKTTVMVATTACADTAAPTSPTGLAASNVTQSSLTLTWNASTDNVGVVAYDVFRNGTKMESTASRSSSQTGLACGVSYWFGVEAYDAAGNRSERTRAEGSTAACSSTPPSSAERVLFDGGFDTGNESQWDYIHRYSPDRYKVVASDTGVTPRKGSHMARVEVRPNEPTSWCATCNISMAQKDDVPGGKSLGDDVYTGFSVYLPNGFQYVPGTYANNIVEWHTTPPMSQAPIHFFLDGTQAGAFNLDLHTAPSGYSPIRWKFGDLVTGRWVDFVFRTNWKNDNTGVIEGWMDGTKRFSWTGLTWGSAVTYVYPEAGYYRANYGASAVLYIDAFKVGTSYSAVAP